MKIGLKKETFITWKSRIFSQSLILFTLALGLAGCPGPEPLPEKTYHFYIALSPINQQQVQQVRAFLNNAQGKVDKTTEILSPGNRYTIAIFCENNTANFPTPGIELPDRKPLSIQAIIGGVEPTLNSITAGEKTCNANAESLANLATHLNENTSKYSEELIVFIQAPWELSDVEAAFSKIQTGMDKLAESGQVKKVILFGVDQESANKVTTAFQKFNQGSGKRTVESPATTIPQVVTYLGQIKEELWP